MRGVKRKYSVLMPCIVFMLAGGTTFAQVKNDAAGATPKPGYYRWPMDMPKLLSANFAELRANHFHSGIDLKTGGSEGHPVRAAAGGYVTRVAVNPSGYGRVAYVAHPNGTTTVYAHLSRFYPALEAYVVNEMYRTQQWRIDLSLPSGRFPVEQGAEIGKSGNSGMSFGPHLHFEVRESATQRTLNPLSLRLFDVKDDIAPTIANLYWFEVDTVLGMAVHAPPRRIPVRKTDGNNYTVGDGKPIEIGVQGYFAVEATDRKNDVTNTFGVYRIGASLDGEPFFGLRKDGFLFSDTRYINSASVYDMQRGARTEFYRLAVQDGNRIPIYHGVRNRGALTLSDTLSHAVSIEVEDDNGNVSRLRFDIRRADPERPFHADFDLSRPVASNTRSFLNDSDGVRILIPSGALYEPVFYSQRIDSTLTGFMTRMGSTLKPSAKPPRIFSMLYTIHESNTPLHKSVTVEIAADVPPALREKAALGYVARDGSVSYAGGAWKPGKVSANVRNFGTYCVVVDTVPPRIAPSFTSGADLKGVSSVSFAISDDFSGVDDYTATIDGQWALFEYDMVKKRITHRFSTFRFAKTGTHTLRLEVVDQKGNRSVWTGTFVR